MAGVMEEKAGKGIEAVAQLAPGVGPALQLCGLSPVTPIIARMLATVYLCRGAKTTIALYCEIAVRFRQAAIEN